MCYIWQWKYEQITNSLAFSCFLSQELDQDTSGSQTRKHFPNKQWISKCLICDLHIVGVHYFIPNRRDNFFGFIHWFIPDFRGVSHYLRNWNSLLYKSKSWGQRLDTVRCSFHDGSLGGRGIYVWSFLWSLFYRQGTSLRD